jgi:tetratricopeptide (TPR) repeat protein
MLAPYDRIRGLPKKGKKATNVDSPSVNSDDIEWKQAHDYFRAKAEEAPDIGRYHVCLGALHTAASQPGQADVAYKSAIATDPSNILYRSDHALHLLRTGRGEEAKREYHNMLVSRNEPLLLCNMAATCAQLGDFNEAERYAKEAYYLDQDNPKQLRNLARIIDVNGRSDEALKYNLRSLEIQHRRGHELSSTALRRTAVQVIANGGAREQALELMSRARQIEGKRYIPPTSLQTNEILRQIHVKKAIVTAHNRTTSATKTLDEQTELALKKFDDITEKLGVL